MKIQYKRRKLNFNLYFGMFWLILFLSQLFFDDELEWIDYSLFICLAYLGTYFYQVKYMYVRINHGVLTVNGPFGKNINLHEIKRIKRFAGDYILKSDNRKLTINTQVIDSKSLAELDQELEKLQVEWN